MKWPALAIGLLLFLAACSSDEREPQQPGGVLDDLHRIVRLSTPPQRIVSLAPSLTETLFALGLDSSVVGVTDFCTYPPRATKLPHVGGLINPNLERIVSLKPDLVVMTVQGNTRSDFEKIEKLGLTVFVSNPGNVEGVFRTIRGIGILTRTTVRADSLINRLQRRRAELERRAAESPPVSVLFLLSFRPLISASSGTYIDEIIRLANGVNIAAGSQVAYPVLNREEILASDPSWIITTSDVAHSPAQMRAALSRFSALAAVREQRFIILDADLISRPGPRILDGLAQLVEAMHPATSSRGSP